MQNDLLITQVYISVLPRLTRYIAARIQDDEEARDIAQDVFVRLLESRTILFSKEAGEALVFKMAAIETINHMRHRSVVSRVHDNIRARLGEPFCEEESGIMARDLELQERQYVATLSPRRREVYCLRRFAGFVNDEIAQRLNLSIRTVENHLFTAMGYVREYMRQCI